MWTQIDDDTKQTKQDKMKRNKEEINKFKRYLQIWHTANNK